MRHPLSFRGEISPLLYAVLAPVLLLTQHAVVAVAFIRDSYPIPLGASFWLLPLRSLTLLPGLGMTTAAVSFAISLFIAWGLALLSFRRAAWSGGGYFLAALAIVPMVQIAAVALLLILPRLSTGTDPEPEAGLDVRNMMQGVLAGVAIIVLAILISAVSFGAYGWGLFVMTPFLVGMTTGFLANRRRSMSFGQTSLLVFGATGIGSLALILLALEGMLCILMAAPLGGVVAIVGGGLGRAAARIGRKKDQPLMSLALLPALFALEAAMPPNAPIATFESIEIAAPPSAVWRALTDSRTIASGPGIIGLSGLAYPIRDQLLGTGVGAERLGEFSTGIARERVTQWEPGRRFAFIVVEQPPAMEEMSPYRKVHAPHVHGYFDTAETRFDLEFLADGRTRLTARANHILKMDPVLYWEPVARWAIHLNVTRVLRDVAEKAVADGNHNVRSRA
ncbi:SRPBCC family protein [Sphingobium sp.]|uniref:SRPBCC family protein n=1 Tax=Sphingobium sp. TaxID=1912891 RepID=UPI0028BF4218|nr:SRPBCC family protein [Sphingobium sp.]